LIGNNIEGDKVFFQGEELDIIQSNLQTTQIDTEAKTSRIAESQIIGKQKHKAIKDLLIERSRLIGEYIQNISQGKLKVDQSVMVGKVIMQGAKDDLQIKDSRMIGSYVTNASGGSMKVDSNQIVGSQELYFAAISQYLLANSGLSLAQYPHQLFTGNFGAIDSAGNPVIRCGIAIDGNEMLGIVNFGSCSSDEFSNLQYEVINSSNIPLSVFKEIAKERPKGVYIDADSGIIMGGSLDAGKHQIMLKTKKGIDILPLGVYNSLMFGGGINDTGIYHAITKIAAGLIDIDGGQIIKLVGVQFQGHVGQLKADYIINEDNVGEVIARAGVFSELKPWLGNAATYDLIINKNVVPTKLEFTETTKIELGKGKIDILYPYSSKKVFLTQKQGDVLLDQDLDVSKHELMAINAENGSILFGLPKTEQQEIIPKLFKMFGIGSGIIQTHSTHNNINVKAQELQLEAGGDVDIHGSLDAKNIGVKAKGQFKLSSDTSNFGKALEQSVVKADNWYVVADDIEINGSLVTVKDQVKLVSNNNVRILPVELLSHYYECSGKTTIKEDAIHQVVSRINAGYLNIDAGKAVDFVSALIEVENLSLDAKSLNISTAKEIFTKQVEFRGSDKWYGAKGSYSREYNHYEKIVPTVINTKNQRIVIDGQATLESAQIFAEEDILFEAKEGIAIKDGYNVHLHDYHEKKYTLMSFNGGSMKVNSNKTVKDFFSQHASVPTIIAAKGHFFGITEGKMHILGSKIVGKDIHIVAPKGLKLEASRYTDSAFTFVHETGSKLGYYHKGNSEAGFAAGVYMNKSKLNTELQHVHESMLCAEDTLSLSIKDGTFEQISSSIRGKLIRVEALNWEARTYSNKVISDHLQQHAELGIKLCAKQNVTQVFDKMNGLVSKRGNHVIDHADRLFKAYDTYKSMAMLPTTATSAGLYAYLDMQETTEHKSASIAVDNIIDGKHIMFKVENDIRFKGVRMTAANVDIEACNFEWETSSDEYEYEYNLGSVGIEVDLVNGANSSMQQAVKDLQSNRKIHHENYIKATGNLKLHLSGTGHFIGCSLEGATLDIKANNLILESVQDIISERLEGMSMHLGFNSAYNAQQIGFNVESGFTKSKWSNQVGQILGSQMVNVVVNETLELAGGIIANQKIDEDGKVTDEANLNINCSRLIVKTIHDYDEGVTLGIGASFQVNKTDNGNDVVFSHMPLKVKYKDQQRDLHGTIGQGNIKSDTIQGDSLNRDIKKTADTTASEEFGFDAVVHKSMFAGDSKTDEDKSFKKIYRSMVQEGTFMQKLANSATDIAGNIKDTGRNLVLGGAKLINIFGGQINRDLLDQKLHELIGKDIHTGIDVKEQERHIAKIQREIDELSESEDLDYERESDREHAYNKIAYVALFNKLEEAIKKIDDTKEQSYLRATNIILQGEYKEELKKAKQDNRPVKSVEVFVNEFLTSEKFNKPIFNAAKQIVMQSASGAKAIVDSLIDMITQEGAKDSVTKQSDIWDAIKPNSGIAAGDDLLGMHNNVQSTFGANNRSIMLQGDMASGRFAAYQAPSSNSPFDQELINLQDRVNYYSVLAASQKQQQQSSTVEMSQETVRFLSNVFQFDNRSSVQGANTTSQSYQPSENTNPVPLYDVAREYKTGNTDNRVKQESNYPFSGETNSASRSGNFFSRIDFSPEQNGAGIGVAETDFYGRPVPSPYSSVTRNNNSQSTFGYVVSELVGFPSAEAAVPIVLGAGASEALVYSAGALGLGTAWWSLNNTATGASEYQAASNYSREGSYQPALTGNLITGGMNTGLFANPVDQMRFDGTIPEVDEQTPRTNIVANKGRAKLVTETETSALLNKDIDTSSDRPAITDFSTHYRPKSILSTPDQSTELAELNRLPGFAPSMLEAWQESFPNQNPIGNSDVHEIDKLLEKHIHEVASIPEGATFKNTTISPMPDPDDFDPDDNEHETKKDKAEDSSKSTQMSNKTKELLGDTDAFKEQFLEKPGESKNQTSLNAAKTELSGEQIDLATKRGLTYDHITKVRNAQNGLINHIKRINNRLSYPDLPMVEREALNAELAKASKLLDHTKNFVSRGLK
jgi:hypothetical protein